MLVLLLGLGTWQLRRLAWKERLLDHIDRAEQLPAMPMPADPSPFAKVEVSGRLREDLSAVYGAEVRDTRDGPTLGGQLIVPLQRPGQETVLVDRGWVPMSRSQPLALAPATTVVNGYVRPAEHPGLFSAKDDPATRRFYTLDPQAIGMALGLAEVAPFTLVTLGPTPPELYPDPARHLPQPPNNHLQYAFTWYGLAAVLSVIFLVHARRVLRS